MVILVQFFFSNILYVYADKIIKKNISGYSTVQLRCYKACNRVLGYVLQLAQSILSVVGKVA